MGSKFSSIGWETPVNKLNDEDIDQDATIKYVTDTILKYVQ